MQYLETVMKSGLLCRLKDADYEHAFDSLKVTGKRMKKGEAIFYEGDQIDRIAILKKGVVCGEKNYGNGDRTILQVVESDEIFALEGISAYKTAYMNYICNENCEIVFINWNDIYKSPYCKELLQALMQKLEDNYIKQMYRMEILSKKGVREKIILYFETRREKEASNVIHINMNRQHLAEYLCINRSVLSNELSKMKKDGLISLSKNTVALKY